MSFKIDEKCLQFQNLYWVIVKISPQIIAQIETFWKYCRRWSTGTATTPASPTTSTASSSTTTAPSANSNDQGLSICSAIIGRGYRYIENACFCRGPRNYSSGRGER